MNESDIRPHFESYGEISEMVVLRDRNTGTSKGCGFVFYRTRQSAVDAIAALNEKLVLPGVRAAVGTFMFDRPQGTSAVQVRPADIDGQKGEDRKLFIGMLSYTTTEDTLRGLFSRYGTVEEAAIIRGPDGTSKGTLASANLLDLTSSRMWLCQVQLPRRVPRRHRQPQRQVHRRGEPLS